MRDEPFNPPPFLLPSRGSGRWTLLIAVWVLRALAGALVLAGRVLLLVLLHLARPLVIWPLLLVAAAGLAATIGFAWLDVRRDAARAGMATLIAASLGGLHRTAMDRLAAGRAW